MWTVQKKMWRNAAKIQEEGWQHLLATGGNGTKRSRKWFKDEGKYVSRKALKKV